MGWVCRLSGLPWSQSPDGLVEVLQRLADHPNLRQQLCAQARERYSTLFSRRVWLLQLHRLGHLVERGKVCNFAGEESLAFEQQKPILHRTVRLCSN